MKRKTIALAVLICLIAASCSSPQEPITISGAWARPAAAGENSAIYFQIENSLAVDDLITGVESSAAQTVQLHLSRMESDGTMVMEHQESVPLPARSTVSFEPGGLHIMLMGLVSDLQPGDTVEAVLRLQDAGSLTITADVRAP